MLLAGHPRGAEKLDTYDAACVAWALLDENHSATAFTVDPKGSDDLHRRLMGLPGGPGSQEEVEELRAAVERGVKEPDPAEEAAKKARREALRAAQRRPGAPPPPSALREAPGAVPPPSAADLAALESLKAGLRPPSEVSDGSK